jgi:hypothetical protein
MEEEVEEEEEEEVRRRKGGPRPCMTSERSQRRTPKYATMTRMSIPAIRLSAFSVEGLLFAPRAAAVSKKLAVPPM